MSSVWIQAPKTGMVARARVASQADICETRTAALLHTGGTTATPKLVRHTERGQLLNAWCSGAWANSSPDAVVANGMPYSHVGGAMCGALFSTQHKYPRLNPALLPGSLHSPAMRRRLP